MIPSTSKVFFLVEKRFTGLVFFAIIGIGSFLTIPFFCSGAFYTDYESNPSDFGTAFVWHWIGDDERLTSDGFIGWDANGFPFWQVAPPYSFYHLKLEPYEATQYPPTYTYWYFADDYRGTNYFSYQSGGIGYSSGCVLVSTIVLTDDTIYSMKCENLFEKTPLQKVEFYAQFYTQKIYGMFYTNEDLSYIDTQVEFYDFMESRVADQTSALSLNYPADGETTASTSVSFGVNYINFDGFDFVGFRIIQSDNYFQTTYIEGDAIDGQSSFSTTTTLGEGAYFYQAYLRGGATSTIYSNEVFRFNVLSNPYDTATTTLVNTDFACDDLGTIAGAFCSVLVKLFKPSPNNLARFGNLGDLLEDKKPFAFFYAFKNDFGDIGASTTPAFALASVAELNDALSPLRAGVGWCLWVLFGIYAIKRIAIHNL